MAHEQGATESSGSSTASTTGSGKRTNVWMIVAIVAIVLAVIAGWLAFSYKAQVDDWEAAANETLARLQAAGLELEDTVASGVADYERQISDLMTQVEQSQTEAGIATEGQAAAEQELADAQAELESTQQQLDATLSQLEETQAALDDANASLEQLGELVLANGTYVGPVLGARTEPLPAIIFQDDTAWRVAEVGPDVTITAGDQELTLEQFSALLQSTDPAAVVLANSDYEVTVKGGVVTSVSGPAA
jgi:hypothetical protein